MTFGDTPSPSPGPRPAKRSRARRFIPLGVAAWLVLEIWLLILVGEAAGGLTVFLLLVAGAVLGGYVIKRAGRRAFRRLTERLQTQTAGDPSAPGAGAGYGPGYGGGPAQSPTGAAQPAAGSGDTLPMLGGLLLMVPGLISDAAGLLCLFPPTRALIHRGAERYLSRQAKFTPGTLGDAFQQARMHAPDGKVVQGEVIRDDDGAQDGPSQRRQDPPLTR